MPVYDTILSFKIRISYGTHVQEDDRELRERSQEQVSNPFRNVLRDAVSRSVWAGASYHYDALFLTLAKGEKMIKVLHVISDTNIGGAGVLLCNLLTCADREQFEISVALPEESALLPRIEGLGVSVIPLTHGEDRSTDLRAIPEITSILRRLRPHILHTHSALYARIAGKLCRVPVAVNTRHCADQATPPSRKMRLAGYLERMSETHTIATADYVKDVLVARGLDARRIHVIHNGSLPIPPLSPGERNSLAHELGIDPSRLVVGMIARLAEGKGHETFLRAAARCLRQSADVEFLIAGDGEKQDVLHRMAKELGVVHRVRFLGFRADAGRIMNLLDVNVNCSARSETSSLSLSEGMSLGVVPVVTDCGGNPFMAGFGKCGAVFPVGDSEALAETLLSLSRNKSRLATLSAACRRRFAEHFTAESMTAKTEALYRRLLTKNTDCDIL